MTEYNYFPILKTTDAELRAYAELPEGVQDNVLPIFELTQSRRSKNNKDGDVWKRINNIQANMVNRPFILDLTTEDSLQNKHIKEMLEDSSKGYKLWVDLVNKIHDKGINIIPIIHYNPEEVEDVKIQINNLKKNSDYLAFRVDPTDNVITYLDQIENVFDLSKLILILDAGYIASDNENPFLPVLKLLSKKDLKATVCVASSFPKNPAKYGDVQGSFSIPEIGMIESLRKDYKIFHGDFGSIHPVRDPAKWGGWVPRVDFLSKSTFFYYRYRREEGGYVKAARNVVDDEHYEAIPKFSVWGDQEIEAASSGHPNGLSPSHWISVRVNLYITHQFLRLKKYPKMSL